MLSPGATSRLRQNIWVLEAPSITSAASRSPCRLCTGEEVPRDGASAPLLALPQPWGVPRAAGEDGSHSSCIPGHPRPAEGLNLLSLFPRIHISSACLGKSHTCQLFPNSALLASPHHVMLRQRTVFPGLQTKGGSLSLVI